MENNPISFAFNSPDSCNSASTMLRAELDLVNDLLPPIPVATLLSNRDGYRAGIFQCDRTPKLQASSARFIRKQYWNVHGATLTGLMFTRFAILDAEQEPCAVVGIKRFGQENTLVEKYLDTPVEGVIGRVTGQPVRRDAIVEVGNLAADSLLQSCRLIVFLLHWLSNTGTTHAVCTGTEAVRLALKRARVPFTTLGDADASRLGEARFRWGSYYDNSPQVLLIDIASGLAAVADRYRCLFADQSFSAETVSARAKP